MLAIKVSLYSSEHITHAPRAKKKKNNDFWQVNADHD
jgi:hypothetical protein